MTKKIFQVGYSVYAILLFCILLVLVFPFSFAFVRNDSTKKYSNKIHTFWAKTWFALCGFRTEFVHKVPLDPAKTYVFVGNHFSYLDVAAAQLITQHHFCFIGKSSVEKIPLLGYLFKKLHIKVDRSTKHSRARALQMGLQKLKNGVSIVIFPEGGIKSQNIPQMYSPWAEGAFVMARETNSPIVPVTYLNNYKAMPENMLWPTKLKIRIDSPLEPSAFGSTEELKNAAFEIIQQNLLNA